jgi:hypothetical protein
MFLFVFLSFLFAIIKFSNEIVLKQQFYNQLQNIIDILNKNEKVNISGELNARIVTEKMDDLIGPHGEAEVNDNGEYLLEFCA